MVTLRIEHAVRDFDDWQRAFAGDPAGREAGGVLAYRVFRPLDDPAYVVVDLDFETAAEADAFADKLRALWKRADAELGLERHTLRIYDVAESRAY